MLLLAKYANELKLKPCHQLDFYNRCQFHAKFGMITMDFIESLPPSNGKNTIPVVVDRLSKISHFLALSHPYTTKMVAEKFVEGVVKLHGMHRTIISNREPV